MSTVSSNPAAADRNAPHAAPQTAGEQQDCLGRKLGNLIHKNNCSIEVLTSSFIHNNTKLTVCSGAVLVRTARFKHCLL